MGTEFLFRKMRESAGDGWWWWLYNSVKVLNATELAVYIKVVKMVSFRGTWVSQSVKRPTSAQVMISRSVSSSPALSSVLTAPSQEPVSDSVSPSNNWVTRLWHGSTGPGVKVNKRKPHFIFLMFIYF